MNILLLDFIRSTLTIFIALLWAYEQGWKYRTRFMQRGRK